MTGIQQHHFDYASLDTETRTFVQEKAQTIHVRLKRTAEDVIAVGQNLIEVKERLGHGQFVSWLQSEFEMSRRIAHNFMVAAERFGEKSANFAHLPVSVLYELAAPSTPEAIIEKVGSGEIPSILSAIREVKREYQESQQQDVSARHFVEEVFPKFTQWQEDNQALNLDRFANPVPVRSDPPQVFSPQTEMVRSEQQRELRREQTRERLAQLREKGAELPTGVYSCLVVDPPWHMQKIERDVRPNQVEFDYPTMTEEELMDFPLSSMAAQDCHLYLWTTQKHIPLAFRLAEQWGFRYQCLLTWVKNVGFTPFSWMYSTEHVLFCTRGILPLLQLGKRLDFHAKVREHSRKPDEFYDLVREVSPGPRLDVFSREKRDGFDQYGNEVDKFVLRA